MDTENNPHHSAASEAVVLHSPSSESGPTSSTESIRHTRDNDGFFKPLPVIKRSPHSRLSLPNIPLRSAKSAQSPYHHSLTSPRGSNIPVPSFRSTGIKSKRESNPSQPTPGTPCKRNPQNLFLSRHPPSRPQSEPQPRLHPHSFRNVVPPSPFGKSKSSDSIQTISLTPKDDDSPSSRVQFNSSNRSSRISSFNNSLQSSPIRNHPASGASAKLPFKRSKSFGSPKSLASNFPTSLVPLSSSRTNPNDQSGMDMPKEDSNENDEDEESDENSNLSPPLLVPPSPVSFPIQFKASTKLPMFGVRPFKQRPVKAHHLDRKYFLENSTLALNEDLSDTDPPDYFETTYTVLDTIGSGSFADVYRVRHIAKGIEYALKATKKAYTGARDRSQKLEEVRTLWAVHGHPNCLQIYEAWEQQGHLYIVTEICPYGSLQAYLEQKATVSSSSPIAPNRTWHVLLDIISGLNYMHSLDIVHLDLKPANLLVSDDGNLKIADFGLSTKVPVSPTFNDDDRDGDNRYLAPEIYRQQYDKPADIFSLGLIMLEIITNSVLPDRGESYQRLRRGDLSDFLPQFPADSSQLFQSTIASMLNPIPSRRPTAKNILELKPIREVMAEKKMRRVSTLGNGKDLGKRFVGSWKSKSRMSFGRSNSFDNRGVVAVAPKATASPSPNSLEKMLGSSVNVSIPHSHNSTFGSVKSSSARWPNSSLNLNNSAVGNKPSPYELSIAVPRIETIENQNTLLVTPTEESFQSIDIMDISHGPQVVPPAVQADATDSSPADSTSTMENQTELPSKFPFTLSSSNLSPFAPTLQAPASLSSADSSQFIQPQFTPTSSQPNVFTTSTASHCLKIPDPTGTAKLISPFANVSPENLFARRSQEESFRDSDDDEIEDDKDTNSVCSECEGGCESQHGPKHEQINAIDEDTREVDMDCVEAEGCRQTEIMSGGNAGKSESEKSKECDSADVFGHSHGSRQVEQTTEVTFGSGGNVSDEQAKMNVDSTFNRNVNSNALWTQFTTLSTCENGGQQATNEINPGCSTTKQSPWSEKPSASKYSKPSPFSISTSSPFLSRQPPLSTLDSNTFSPTTNPSSQTTKNSLNRLLSPSPSTSAPTFGFHTQPRNQLHPRFQQSSFKPSSSSTQNIGTEISPFSSPMVQPISFAASRIAPMSAPPANAGRTNNNLNCTDQNRFGCSFVPSGDQQCQSTGLNRSQISSFNFNDMSRTSTSLPISGMGILPRELPKRNENSFSRPSFLDTLRNSKDDDSSDDDEIVGAGGKKRINLFHGNSSISFINPKLQASKGISRDGETDDEFKSEDCNMGILRTRKLPLNETSVGTLNGESQNLEAGSGLTKCGVHKTQQGERSKYPHGVNPRNDQIDEVTQFFTSPSSASRIHQAQTTPFSFSSSFPGAVSFSGTPASSQYSLSQKGKDRRRRDFSTDDSVTLMSQLPPDSISKSPNSSAFDTVFSPQSSNNPHSSLLVPTDSSNLELREKADFKEEGDTNQKAMKKSKSRETLANIVHSLDIISGDQP